MSKKSNLAPIEEFVIDYVIKLRNDRSLTQQDIADIIGISRSYIKDIENPQSIAKYNLKHINALADYFNISPASFLPTKAFPTEGIGSKRNKK